MTVTAIRIAMKQPGPIKDWDYELQLIAVPIDCYSIWAPFFLKIKAYESLNPHLPLYKIGRSKPEI